MKTDSENITLVVLPKEKLLPIISTAFDNGSPFVLTVSGYSMRPTLHNQGDKVELVSKEKRAIKKGELVFFERENGECILHRVIKAEGDVLTVNGDAQVFTEKVKSAQVIGVARRLCRSSKWISCDSFLYRVYSSVWMALKPVRRVLIKLKSLFRK